MSTHTYIHDVSRLESHVQTSSKHVLLRITAHVTGGGRTEQTLLLPLEMLEHARKISDSINQVEPNIDVGDTLVEVGSNTALILSVNET